ncbi:hypothetical protein FQN60_010211 [Etheostoma spectabile]|uniref:Uncharacterized protein n=1 Tax=Etheostoma spectabile TaxID=54343 RepID=A0A5J5D8A0_9PERO|nr:hypothetical protein FQN60_010211 [Etheostoma spectabile]
MEKDGMVFPVLGDPKWLMDLTFLIDITQELNVLNKKLKDQGQLVSAAYENLSKKPLPFPSKLALMDIVTQFSGEKYADAIMKLQEEFDHRFSDFKAQSHFSNFC